MKRILLTLGVALAATLTALAETATVTFATSMHCESCEQRIKKNVRFEKGVKKIDVSLPAKTVTVTYDTEKTSPEALRQAIVRLGYKAEVLPAKADGPTGQKQQ